MYVIYVTMYAIYKDLSTIDVECNFQIKCECDGVHLSCSTFYLYFFLLLENAILITQLLFRFKIFFFFILCKTYAFIFMLVNLVS